MNDKFVEEREEWRHTARDHTHRVSELERELDALKREHNLNVDALWGQIHQLVVKTLIAVQPHLAHAYTLGRPSAPPDDAPEWFTSDAAAKLRIPRARSRPRHATRAESDAVRQVTSASWERLLVVCPWV